MSNRGLLSWPAGAEFPGRGLFSLPRGYPPRTAPISTVPFTGALTSGNNGFSAWSFITLLPEIDYRWIEMVVLQGLNNTQTIYDIGINTQGDQSITSNIEVILPSIHHSSRPVLGGARWGDPAIHFPVRIPGGSALFIRSRQNGGSDTFTFYGIVGSTPYITGPLGLAGISGDNELPSNVLAFGVTGSQLTLVDPGATINTKGAWVQLSQAIPQELVMLWLMRDNNGNATMTDCNWLVDIGVGHAGAEQVLISDLEFRADDANDHITPPLWGPFPTKVASGSRLAVRASCTINDATDRLIRLGIYAAAV